MSADHHKWTLESGLELVRHLAPLLEAAGFTIALGGSVLKRGYSEKDIDIIVHPLCAGPGNRYWKNDCAKVLAAGGLRCRHDVSVVRAKWKKQGSLDQKHVEIWSFNGRRVDVFFME